MSTGTTPFWPNSEHWSVKIPLDTPHPRSKALAETGFVMLKPMPVHVPSHEWESLEYMDWKSGGDTNFAPLASADGQLDCRGFWDKGKTDKDALWTSNADKAPTLRDYVTAVGANFGRVRIIKLEPQDRETAIRSIHRDDNNRFNPDDEGWVVRSWVELTDSPTVTCCSWTTTPTDFPIAPPSDECRWRAARASWSTRNGCGTWWCTTRTPLVTR